MLKQITETKKLVLQKLSLAQIVKERGLVQGTIISHLEQLADKASQLDLQAFSVARAMFIVAAKRLNQSMTGEGDTLSLTDQERLLKMCDLAHRMGRRALGVGDRSD